MVKRRYKPKGRGCKYKPRYGSSCRRYKRPRRVAYRTRRGRICCKKRPKNYHKIRRGKRGGRYYISANRKVYVK